MRLTETSSAAFRCDTGRNGTVYVFYLTGLDSNDAVTFDVSERSGGLSLNDVASAVEEDGLGAVVTRAPDSETAHGYVTRQLKPALQQKIVIIARRDNGDNPVIDPTRSGSTHHGYNAIGRGPL